MKIIHTGDWHIGKIVHGVHMTDDQDYVLNSLINVLKKEKPDILIISGDIYDRSIPPVEAVKLLDDILYDIVIKNNIKVIGIAGNHDSPRRLSFGSRVFESNGLHIKGKIEGFEKPICIGNTRFYVIPYIEPAQVRYIYDDNSIKTHEDVLKFILNNISLDNKYFNICLYHGFVINQNPIDASDSVRPLAIGGVDYVSVDLLKKFDYVALGHLHKPQKVKYDYIRYAGSLLKYSFSEVNQKKSVTILEYSKKDNLKIRQEILDIKRDLKVVRGTLDEILSIEDTDIVNSYLKVFLEDKGKLINPMSKLKKKFKNILSLERKNYGINSSSNNSSAEGNIKKKSDKILFKEFYYDMLGEELSRNEEKIVEDILNEIKDEGRNS